MLFMGTFLSKERMLTITRLLEPLYLCGPDGLIPSSIHEQNSSVIGRPRYSIDAVTLTTTLD